ncbi:hypothetical protein GCM10020001_087120 [Nonomuraea salmonea]
MFPYEDVDYPRPFSMKTCRETMPRAHWPRLRTYTVRAWDPDALELTLDFVVHGDEGLAGPWAAQAAPGDELIMLGPGGAATRPTPTPPGTSWWATRARCRPSPPRWRRCPRARPRTCSSRWTPPRTS